MLPPLATQIMLLDSILVGLFPDETAQLSVVLLHNGLEVTEGDYQRQLVTSANFSPAAENAALPGTAIIVSSSPPLFTAVGEAIVYDTIELRTANGVTTRWSSAIAGLIPAGETRAVDINFRFIDCEAP